MPDSPFNFTMPGQTPGFNQGGGNLPGGFSLDQVLDVGGDIWDFFTGGDDPASSNGTSTVTAAPSPSNAAGCAIVMPIQTTQRAKCARGYVAVNHPQHGRVCMLKEAARSCGLYKAPAKPPIKASDWRCLRKSASVVKKVDRIAKMANTITGKANLSRTRRSR
tara:strand:+ start:296 stop:784 length:489 start_codon:yes stop_codon:yes gene_type:complete